MPADTSYNSTQRTQLLSLDNSDDVRLWDALVDSASLGDVYHRPGYVAAYQAAGHGRAAALLVEKGNLRVLFPLLLRSFSDLPFTAGEVDAVDAATPYGYGGLLPLAEGEYVPEGQLSALFLELRSWCCHNRIVSILLRLHPLLQQKAWLAPVLDSDCRMYRFGPTTALDLSKWNEATASIATLHKGRWSDLSRARRSLRVTWASQRGTIAEDLRVFYSLYEERMSQLRASDYYHFPWEYYAMLASGLGRKLDVAIAWLGEQPVGAALFLADRTFAHYHLSASNDAGRTHKATTLILNAAADWARRSGCRYLHLGGGATGDDNLFNFKKSFGGELYEYSFVGVIGDRELYDSLLQRRLAAGLPPVRPNFFPEYRA